MSQATNANSVIKTFVAGGVIHPGHAVTVSGATVIEASGANAANGIYVGEANCASGDHVPVCIAGPCRAWCDAAAAIALFANLATDASGHCVVDTTDKHKLIGQALEALASGTGYVEINVNIGWLAA
jgi:hypothetical protein